MFWSDCRIPSCAPASRASCAGTLLSLSGKLPSLQMILVNRVIRDAAYGPGAAPRSSPL